jgi:hypothetical protein
MLTPDQRKQWLRQHNAAPGMVLMHISEVNQVMQQLVSQRFALQQISQLLGPYTIAAKGNPVDAAGRCFNAAEALRKRVAELEQELLDLRKSLTPDAPKA